MSMQKGKHGGQQSQGDPSLPPQGSSGGPGQPGSQVQQQSQNQGPQGPTPTSTPPGQDMGKQPPQHLQQGQQAQQMPPGSLQIYSVGVPNQSRPAGSQPFYPSQLGPALRMPSHREQKFQGQPRHPNHTGAAAYYPQPGHQQILMAQHPLYATTGYPPQHAQTQPFYYQAASPVGMQRPGSGVPGGPGPQMSQPRPQQGPQTQQMGQPQVPIGMVSGGPPVVVGSQPTGPQGLPSLSRASSGVRRKFDLDIIDPKTMKSINNEIYVEGASANSSPPGSQDSSARQTPRSPSVPDTSAMDVIADFAARVAKVASEESAPHAAQKFCEGSTPSPSVQIVPTVPVTIAPSAETKLPKKDELMVPQMPAPIKDRRGPKEMAAKIVPKKEVKPAVEAVPITVSEPVVQKPVATAVPVAQAPPPAVVEEHKQPNGGVESSDEKIDCGNPINLDTLVQNIINKQRPMSTDVNVDTLAKEIRELPISKIVHLERVVDMIFLKAVEEPALSQACAQMCKVLTGMPVLAGTAESEELVNIRAFLVNRCRTEFEKQKALTLSRDLVLEEVGRVQDRKQRSDYLATHLTLERKVQSTFFRSIGFYGVLFNAHLLSTSLMHLYIAHLLSLGHRESLECLCSLLTTIGKTLESKSGLLGNANDLTGYFTKLTVLMEECEGVSPALYHMIQELITFRERNWAPQGVRPSSNTMVPLLKPLKKTLTTPAWSAWSSNRPASIPDLYKSVRGILNKLTPQKFDTLVSQMQALPIDSSDKLQGVINLVFEKAVCEPLYATLYAQMCKVLSGMQVPTERKTPEEPEFVNFRKLIVNRCQAEFEKNNEAELNKDAKLKQINLQTDAEKKKALKLMLEEDQRKIRMNSLGNMRFIGELFKLQMLTTSIMHRCIRQLLTAGDEESLECLCKLLTTIGKDLEQKAVNSGELLDQIFTRIRDIANNRGQGSVSSRVRFVLQDVIELRQSLWVPRRDDANPKTMYQIQEEIDRETMDMHIALVNPRTSWRDKRGGGRDIYWGRKGGGAGGGQRGDSGQQGGDGWTNVPDRTNRNMVIDSSRLKVNKTKMEVNLGSGLQFSKWSRAAGGATKSEEKKPAQGDNIPYHVLQDNPASDEKRGSIPPSVLPSDFSDASFDGTDGGKGNGGTDTKDKPTDVPPPDDAEIATVLVPKVHRHQHLQALSEWFPLVELEELQGICETFCPDVSFETLVTSLMESQEVPAQNAPAADACLQAVQHQVENLSQEDLRDGGFQATLNTPAIPAGRQHKNAMYLSEMFPDILVEEVERRCDEFDANASLEVMINAFLENPVPLRHDQEQSLADLYVALSEHPDVDIGIEEPMDLLQWRLPYLIEIFPDVDPAVLQDRWEELGLEASIDDVVSSLVASHGGNVDTVIAGAAVETTEADLELLNAYESVLNILSDADPDYLREKFETIGKNEDAWKQFVADALETGDYPTYEDYAKRQVTVKLQRKFRENFSVKDFVETFPDPFKHFREKVSTVDKSYMLHQNAFLRSRYWFVTDDAIQIVQTEKMYNLYNTCKELDTLDKPAENRPDFDAYLECYTDVTSQDLLEEIAFIENEDRITQYIAKQKKQEKAALEKARRNRELLTCGCCYDESVLPKSMTSCEDGHLFCKDCVRKSAQVLIGMGKTAFPCLSDCGKNISWKALKEVLNPTVFSRVCQRQQLEEVQAAKIPDLEVCPFCDFGAIPLETDIVFTCLNPDCMQISCRLCKEPNHIPLHCDELPEKDAQVKLRTYIEARMTDALIRECWQCHKKFIKSDGCNKMTCTCGALMCYLCRKPVKDYSHFNGQGGDKIHLCPLWSQNAELHELAVQNEAVKAKKEVERQNPTVTLKHDPTLVLP